MHSRPAPSLVVSPALATTASGHPCRLVDADEAKRIGDEVGAAAASGVLAPPAA